VVESEVQGEGAFTISVRWTLRQEHQFRTL